MTYPISEKKNNQFLVDLLLVLSHSSCLLCQASIDKLFQKSNIQASKNLTISPSKFFVCLLQRVKADLGIS